MGQGGEMSWIGPRPPTRVSDPGPCLPLLLPSLSQSAGPLGRLPCTWQKHRLQLLDLGLGVAGLVVGLEEEEKEGIIRGCSGPRRVGCEGPWVAVYYISYIHLDII